MERFLKNDRGQSGLPIGFLLAKVDWEPSVDLLSKRLLRKLAVGRVGKELHQLLNELAFLALGRGRMHRPQELGNEVRKLDLLKARKPGGVGSPVSPHVDLQFFS